MVSQDPREFTNVVRDPVHGYVVVPLEIHPIVQSRYVQRLRNISQNSRAVAAYPSLNGSRYEHALGTMHLSMTAWRTAWDNIWGSDGELTGDRNRQALQVQFSSQVFKDVQVADSSKTLKDPLLKRKLRLSRYDSEKWHSEFHEVMAVAIGVVGLLHDVGHPPFSHVLEGPYSDHARSIFGNAFVNEWASGQRSAKSMQFHEFASSRILELILGDKTMTSGVSTYLVRTIFNARGPSGTAPDWARCIHQLIDGQVDVDRLDYISRDSMRAGANYHAMDHQRLLGNLELHYSPTRGKRKPHRREGDPKQQVDRNPWQVGVGMRGISAVESLLSQRELSYRWMIFHQKAIAADSCLKRVFADALANYTADRIPLDYVQHWKLPKNGDLPSSFTVDDHSVMVWLRSYRALISRSSSSDKRRILAMMRVYEELQETYVPSWRNYGEVVTALKCADPSVIESMRNIVVEVRGRAGGLKQLDPLDARAPDDMAKIFSEYTTWLNAATTNLEARLEFVLNQDQYLAGVEGVWVVAHKLDFKAFKSGVVHLWDGDSKQEFEVLSPVHAGLIDAELKRPKIWAFFIPLKASDMSKIAEERNTVASRFLSALASLPNSLTPTSLALDVTISTDEEAQESSE